MNDYERGTYLKSPYVYFGGKSLVAPDVWTRFGDVDNFVEPFFGSGAVLLGRPDWTPSSRLSETVNDVDGFIVNFWRALRADPEAVAHYADQPMYESNIHAIHAYLVARADNLTQRLEGDPNFYNARYAGWWVFGLACWIGSGFCSGDGPWVQVQGENGDWLLVNKNKDGALPGVARKLPKSEMNGVNAVIHSGISRQLPKFGGPQGVKRIIPKTNINGVLCPDKGGLLVWMEWLAERFRYARVCCGDWTRVCTDSTTIHSGNVSAVFLDPPYTSEGRGSDFKSYRNDDLNIAHSVREWCAERGVDPRFRIALCGYQGEHDSLVEKHGWGYHDWKGPSGYANQDPNSDAKAMRKLERIWFSPHCLQPRAKPSLDLF